MSSISSESAPLLLAIWKMEIINQIINSPHFPKSIHYLTTLFGSAAMYIFSLNKGFEGSTKFLKKFFPGKSQVFYDRLDFFIVVLAGSMIGTIFFNPDSTLEALAAGFGWAWWNVPRAVSMIFIVRWDLCSASTCLLPTAMGDLRHCESAGNITLKVR